MASPHQQLRSPRTSDSRPLTDGLFGAGFANSHDSGPTDLTRRSTFHASTRPTSLSAGPALDRLFVTSISADRGYEGDGQFDGALLVIDGFDFTGRKEPRARLDESTTGWGTTVRLTLRKRRRASMDVDSTFPLLNRTFVNLHGRPWTYWRKAWDSNPRKPEDFNGFRGRPIRPLWQPSGRNCTAATRAAN